MKTLSIGFREPLTIEQVKALPPALLANIRDIYFPGYGSIACIGTSGARYWVSVDRDLGNGRRQTIDLEDADGRLRVFTSPVEAIDALKEFCDMTALIHMAALSMEAYG